MAKAQGRGGAAPQFQPAALPGPIATPSQDKLPGQILCCLHTVPSQPVPVGSEAGGRALGPHSMTPVQPVPPPPLSGPPGQSLVRPGLVTGWAPVSWPPLAPLVSDGLAVMDPRGLALVSKPTAQNGSAHSGSPTRCGGPHPHAAHLQLPAMGCFLKTGHTDEGSTPEDGLCLVGHSMFAT